jgi:hypothetical protein
MYRLLPVLVLVLGLGLGLPPRQVAQQSPPVGTPPPLDDATLRALVILGFAPEVEPQMSVVATLGTAIGLPPGTSLQLVLGVIDREVCGIGIRCFVPVEVSATWSIMPEGSAHIDPTSGLLTIAPTTPTGSQVTVLAEIEGGRRVVSTQITVMTEVSHPFIGYWRETAQLSCDGGADITPALPIEELVFAADGTFAVTWTPFESYVDYWGTYTADPSDGTLELFVTGGNGVPADLDSHGRFTIDADGQLVLSDLWLGTPRSGTTPPQCGHRLVG